jgi:hypothetical protein
MQGWPPSFHTRMRSIIEGQVINSIRFSLCCGWKRRVDNHCNIAALLGEPDRLHTVACLLKQDKVLGI